MKCTLHRNNVVSLAIVKSLNLPKSATRVHQQQWSSFGWYNFQNSSILNFPCTVVLLYIRIIFNLVFVNCLFYCIHMKKWSFSAAPCTICLFKLVFQSFHLPTVMCFFYKVSWVLPNNVSTNQSFDLVDWFFPWQTYA